MNKFAGIAVFFIVAAIGFDSLFPLLVRRSLLRERQRLLARYVEIRDMAERHRRSDRSGTERRLSEEEGVAGP